MATRYGHEQPGDDWRLSSAQQKLLEAVRQGKHTERSRFFDTGADTKSEFIAYGFPLLVRERIFGYLYLYLDGPEKVFALDSSDLAFLNALTRQLALALDRAALERRWKEEKDRESRLLKREVRELRQVIHSAKLVYRSTQMHALLETLTSVAATDVTILITGESGTGEEMLARAVHEQSPRKKKPLITVDCGAIAHTLMEAELFGYVKGAYTGAQSASPGRFLQADGGTLFLDEIGELPLDVQAKLPRFVQEKEISPLGGGKTRCVDVRIIAATNRDLTEEVAAGRFRSDLYYRLQVITLTAPPLRERPDDIIPLARHFLEKFAVQYEKGMLHLTDEAEKALLAYPWPGNIRELQNTIMRAAVISKSEQIDRDVLSLTADVLSDPTGLSRSRTQPGRSDLPPPSLPLKQPDQPGQPPAAAPLPETGSDVWKLLRVNLRARLDAILQADRVAAVPLGKWLMEDLVLAADRLENGVARRAAARLGLPETTFRRQLEKLKQAEQAGVLSRTDDWQNIQPLLAELVRQLQESAAENIIERARTILLQEIIAQIPQNKSLGSALLGVTLPTYHRWLKKSSNENYVGHSN